MRMTATMSSWTLLTGHLRERGLTVAGLSYGTARLVLEQLVGRAVGQLGQDAASLLDRVQADRLQLVDCVVGVVVFVATVAEPWPTGPLGTVGMLVLPVGGPVWAGLLPVSTMWKAIRNGALRLSRPAVRNPTRVLPVLAGCGPLPPRGVKSFPATCNVLRPSACEAGRVSLRVLIVDDSALFRDVARRLLERDGMEVVGIASTVAEAVAQVEALHPQVALVDVNLAGESGFEVARQLAGRDGTAGTAVILTSTHSESEYSDLIVDSPAVGFVAKERMSGETILAAAAPRPR